MIMTDQQRSETIRALGHDHMITPNLDRIFRDGVAFTNAYTCGATCISARAALFTGMYAHNTGTYSFNEWAHHRGWVHDLRDAGYTCVNIGKMHLSPRDDPWAFHERVIVENPTNKAAANGGADDDWGRYLSLHGVRRPNDRNMSDPAWHHKFQGVPWEEAEHLHSDVFIGNSALGFLQRHVQTGPVFFQIGFTGPHEPYDPLPRHFELYRERRIPPAVRGEGELDRKPMQHRVHEQWHRETAHESSIDLRDATNEQIAHMRRSYYANITTIDEKIGEILAALEARGYLDNALVLFLSDHGDMLGDHGLAYKWLMYDGAVKVPMALWRPGTNDGTVVDDPTSLIDVGPTVLEAANVPVPKYLEGEPLRVDDPAKPIDGRGSGDDGADQGPRPVFCEDNYLLMVRHGAYKYVHYIYQEDDCELYDLESDPHELNNLFHREPEIVKEFRVRIALWLSRSCYRTSTYKNNAGGRNAIWPLMPEDGGHLHPGGLRRN
jgi:arylsulfatase A-like enzyme